MKKTVVAVTTLLVVVLLQGCATSSPKAFDAIGTGHYQVYRGDGTLSSIEELLDSARQHDVTFLGEMHNDPVAHHLEEKLLKDLWQENWALSLEMFETDVQFVIDEYLAGHISKDHLKKSGRAWKYYDTDYQPMVEFINDKKGTIIAANPPRRYVNLVSRKGKDALLELPELAKSFLPPLPYADPSQSYADKFKHLMSKNMGMRPVSHDTVPTDQQKLEEKNQRIERTLQAQSLWDAGMAWSIARYLMRHPKNKVLHVNGGFHSAERMGILEHLSGYRSNTSMLVVTILPNKSFPAFDTDSMEGQGDFVIVTDESLPRR